MTHNQINYWTLRETQRANRSKELETNRHNLATEDQSRQELVEASRSNRAREAETVRHNVASESETYRHNAATEAQEANDLLERSRSNRAQESLKRTENLIKQQSVNESVRSNMANEVIGRSNAASNLISANSNSNYRTGQLALGAVDTITRQRAQQEVERSNKVNEQLRESEIGAKFGSQILSTLGGLGQSLLRR